MILFLLLSAQAPAAIIAPPPFVMPAPPAPPGPRAEIVRGPEPLDRQPIESLFSPDDYPAAGDGTRGVVSVVLTIDPGGRVVSCGIQQSSGQAVLDMYTCNILRRRSRFTPAMDSNGNAVTGTVKAQVDWDEVFRKFGMN
jgi:periplasmic protein TonB